MEYNSEFDKLYFGLRGTGKFVVKFGLHRWGFSHKWLSEEVVELFEGKDLKLKLPFWPDLTDGLLYAHLTAVTTGELVAATFETSDSPLQNVKLGIVITHYNRKKYVIPAVRRIKREILNNPDFRERISLIVIDNSQNITQAEAEGATVISNRNLGGSGGFTRGLMHLEDEGTFSHCLFMDDDASCEAESIRRAYALLSFSKQEKFAVAGALLREIESYRLYEKGARFKKLCRPLKSGLDMRVIHDLLLSERADEEPDFGGWWFFCFALKDVRNYPFPFFVRGDDILFGLMHRFNICTMNGIAVWGEDFSFKSGPLPLYLDSRNNLLLFITHLKSSRRATARMISKFFYGQLISYNYASASAISLALEHVRA